MKSKDDDAVCDVMYDSVCDVAFDVVCDVVCGVVCDVVCGVVCDAVLSVEYNVCVATDRKVAQKLVCVCNAVFDVMRDRVFVIFVYDVVCDGVCCGGVVGKVE